MKKIIVAPLNWGLGHATRCVPIIKLLLQNNFTPVIASDGEALIFLQKEFPKLEYIELPSYTISYGKNLKWSLLLKTPKILRSLQKEEQIIANYCNENNDLIGIISDNRFGVRCKKVPSVYLTHQITVLSGFSTFLTSKIHQQIIRKFDECWIPDSIEVPTFSGKLSQTQQIGINVKRIGILSRFQQEKLPIENDALIILSGPEPQRSILEKKLLSEFGNYNKKVVLVQGKVEKKQHKSRNGNITIYNYMLSHELQNEINKSDLIICRSGYSSIMDLAKLKKNAFFIPTPNQNEQEYLASYLEAQKIAPFANQNDFKVEMLQKVKEYRGLCANDSEFDSNLFNLFERKRKS